MSAKRRRGTTFTTNYKPPISNRGFTLIELLVVISIIAILISVGITSYLQAQRQGRDAQRKSDLATVANALEQFYSDNNRYPSTIGDGKIRCGLPSEYNYLDWKNLSIDPPVEESFACDFDGLTGSNPAVVYLGILPGDPSVGQGHPQYFYEATDVLGTSGCSLSVCQRFILAAVLENTNDSEIVLGPTGCLDAGGNVYNYCVYNP